MISLPMIKLYNIYYISLELVNIQIKLIKLPSESKSDSDVVSFQIICKNFINDNFGRSDKIIQNIYLFINLLIRRKKKKR